MTISAVVPDIAFAGSSGSGTLGPFSLVKSGTPIVFYNNSEVIVYRYDTTSDTTPTLLVEGTDYTLTGGPTAGSITLTSPQTGLLTAERLYVFTKISIAQALDLINGGSFSAANIERRLDIMTAIMQQLDREIKSTIRFAMFDTDEIPKTTPLGAVIDKIPYVTGTASSPTVAYLDALVLADLAALTDEEREALVVINADLSGADTIGIVAADLSGDDTIGTVATNITFVIAVAGALDDGSLGTSVVLGNSAEETDAALTVTRTFTGTAAERIATMTLRNTGDAVGGQDYQNEVHLRLWAGTTTTHRRYIDFMKFNEQPDYVMGSNAGGTFILFDEDANVHRLWIENGATLSGDTMINAAGASGKVRIGYHAADTLPPTAFNFYTGGAPANNKLAFNFDVANGVLRKYLHTDGTTQQFIIDADGDVGIGKANPSFKLDIETTGNAPFRMVWGTGTFSQNAHSAAWTTTGTNASDMLTMTDGDNNAARAVLNLKGNAGSQEVLYAASNGNVGIRTGASPTAALDINSDLLRIRTAKTPASATAAGNAGDFCWDASYLYICTATNTWRRVAHATW